MAASAGYFYSDENPNIEIHSNPEIYNFTAGMEMIGFSSKNLNHQHISDNNSLLWNRSFFPCDENQRPAQPLSLSLTSSNQHLKFGSSSSRSIENIQQTTQFCVRNSKYLEPAQELLNDFCKLEISKMTSRKRNLENDAVVTESILSLNSFDLQKRKTKLLQMLQEVHRIHIRIRIRIVLSWF